jgi:spermidine/putrescine transport system ATP-binding protein
VSGTVLDASYVGVSTQYLVQTADGHHMTVYAQNLDTSGSSEAIADGELVRLSWQPQHTFAIDQGRGATSESAEVEEEPGT